MVLEIEKNESRLMGEFYFLLTEPVIKADK